MQSSEWFTGFHTRPIQRPPDGDGLYILYTGGLRAAKADENRWVITPYFSDKKPCFAGYLRQEKLRELTTRIELQPIALHRFGWVAGRYDSSLLPIRPGKANRSITPANQWSNISYHLAKSRTDRTIDWDKPPHPDELARVLDERKDDERLARSISYSLGSLDIHVEKIAEFYFEQIVNVLSKGSGIGELIGTTQDHSFFSHIHSFFAEFGAVRDYLGALIAARLGHDPKKIDSLRKMAGRIEEPSMGRDALLDLLLTEKLLVKNSERGRWSRSGWLRSASDIRDQFVHRRPYGLLFPERSGKVVPVAPGISLFRYERPFILSEGHKADVLDIIAWYYLQISSLFSAAADASGYDQAIPQITGKDIISIKEVKR